MYASLHATGDTATLLLLALLWESSLPLCNDGSPLIRVKATDLDEIIWKYYSINILKVELTLTAYAPFHVWT